MPGPAEGETSVPVKVSGMDSDLNRLLYHVVNITCGLIQDGAATEIDVLPFYEFVLCHS